MTTVAGTFISAPRDGLRALALLQFPNGEKLGNA
jgi:hypothetical protein